MIDQLEQAMTGLTDQQRDVLRLRYGLKDGKQYTLADIAKLMKLSRARIGQIESKAIMRLSHPARSGALKELFMDLMDRETAPAVCDEPEPVGEALPWIDIALNPLDETDEIAVDAKSLLGLYRELIVKDFKLRKEISSSKSELLSIRHKSRATVLHLNSKLRTLRGQVSKLEKRKLEIESTSYDLRKSVDVESITRDDTEGQSWVSWRRNLLAGFAILLANGKQPQQLLMSHFTLQKWLEEKPNANQHYHLNGVRVWMNESIKDDHVVVVFSPPSV